MSLHLPGRAPSALSSRRSRVQSGSASCAQPLRAPQGCVQASSRRACGLVLCQAAKPEGEALGAAKKKGFGKPTAATVAPEKLCPCGSEKLYDDCCGPIHKGAVEQSAEDVVKARFSAYVKLEGEYIVNSTHPTSPDARRAEKEEDNIPQLRKDIANTLKNLKFMKLTLVRSEAGETPDEAFVTFRASYQERKANTDGGKSLQMGTLWKESRTNRTLSQKSRFLKEGGRWKYVSSIDLSLNSVGKY